MSRSAEHAGSVLTVGTFDGVHRGHRAVLTEIADRARRTSRRSVLVTFEPHPLEIVNPHAAPPLLTLPHERREILAQCELDRVVILPFTRSLSHYTPEQFVGLLRSQYQLEELVIGHDHGFGRGRAGDADLVRRLGERDGFAVDIVEAVSADGQLLSSTRIRRAVAGGDLATAEALLGRAYSYTGPVIPGAGRGREIGFRTVNIAFQNDRKLLPPDGVYAVRLEWREGSHGGMMHQGPRPTFGDSARSLEVHLFDMARDLYGQQVKVSWVARLRDVQTFPNAEALRQQLDRDQKAALTALTVNALAASH